MVGEITCRRAKQEDISLLAGHHRLMFEEMRSALQFSHQTTCCGPDCGTSSATAPVARTMDFESLEQAHREKLALQLPEGTCFAWIAELQGEPVGSGGLSILRTVPVPEDPSFVIGFIHSIYILPSRRRRGIASTLVERLLDDARKKGLRRVQLAASEAGKSLYGKKGFQPFEQMILWL